MIQNSVTDLLFFFGYTLTDMTSHMIHEITIYKYPRLDDSIPHFVVFLLFYDSKMSLQRRIAT